MRLVLDSSVITEGDWHLSGPAAEVLLAASRRGQLRLVIPELVIREVVNSHWEKEEAGRKKLDDARSALRRLQGSFSSDIPRAEDYPARNEEYAAGLRHRLERARVHVAAIPEVAQEEVVTRALARRRPFDKRGHGGYRDALIWSTVLDQAIAYELTVFAARDGDYADENDPTKPHPHLCADLEARGLAESAVRICASLEDAVALVLEPAREIVDRLNDRLAEDDDWRNEVEGLVEQLALHASDVDDTGVQVAIETSGEPFEGFITNSELEEIRPQGGVSVQDAYALSETLFIVRMEMSAEAVYRLEVATEGFWRDPGRVPEDLDLSRDERSAYFGGFAHVTLHFSGRYDSASDQLADIELNYLTD